MRTHTEGPSTIRPPQVRREPSSVMHCYFPIL